MKKVYTLASLFTLLLINVSQPHSFAQDNHPLQAANGMTAKPENYKWFTPEYKDLSKEVIEGNKGYEQHPEIGMLFAETPCDNCYEVIEKRTESSKFFVKKDTKGKDIMQQTSNMPMHMKDGAGNWKTIKARIEPDKTKVGVYAAYDQPVPVCINTTDKLTTLGKEGERIAYNRNLELVYLKPDNTEVSLGAADWATYTAGDDGVYVTNAWPGVDIEMRAIRGAIKTNFIVNHAMPEYADGKLLVRDHLQMDNGLSLSIGNNTKHTGNIEVLKNSNQLLYAISAANAYEKSNPKKSLQTLEYSFDANALNIELPGNFLNRESAAYPIIIDPLVSTATATAVTGSTYSAAWTVACVYANAATVPANCTVTDIQWTFNYTTSAGALLDNGAVTFTMGACSSPGLTGYYWYCNFAFAGTCTGTAVSIFSDAASSSYLSSCVSAPQCTPYDLNINMNFFQDYHTSAACASTYVSGATPYTITVFGHTVEINPVIATGPTTICAGQSTNLTCSANYGVPPYTFTWMPGSLTGSSVSVSPAVTTTYTVTVTDACGITGTSTQLITVNPIAPITGSPTVCVGGNTTLTETAGPGTWSSSAPGTASVGSSTGIVNGVAPGTATITFTTSLGCTTTFTVTVTLLSPITGTTSVCVGSTTTLADATPGGTWTCAPAGIATINPATGVVTGQGAGTAVVTYSTPGGCSTTVNVTVNALPLPISGPTNVCQGSVTTITETSTGGTWSLSPAGIATINAAGQVTGVSPGNVTITYTLPTSCYITENFTINPTFNTSFNASICEGNFYAFGGNIYNGTGVYPHTFTSVSGCDSTVTLHLTVNPINYVSIFDSTCSGTTYSYNGHTYSTTGSYLDTFTNVNGCDSIVTLNLFIKPLPAAPVTTPLVYCQHDVAPPLTAAGSNLLWYAVPTGGVGTAGAFIPSTATPGINTYYVSQTVDGCEGPRAPLQVTVHVHPIFSIAPAKPYDCQKDTLTLYYSGPVFPGATFSWSIPSYANITTGTLSTPLIVLEFDTTNTHNYVWLTVGDGYAPCNATDSFDVPVYLTSPQASFYVKEDVCVGDSVKIGLTNVGPGVNDYIWNFDGGNILVSSSDHGGPYKVAWNTAGIYTVSLNALSSPFCPSVAVYDTVHVHDRPIGTISGYSILDGKSSVCIGDSVILRTQKFDAINSYTWSPAHFFNEQNNADTIVGIIEFAGYVKLTTVSPYGCSAEDSVLINAQPCCTVTFPLAFSPNGDHHNDVFRPVTPGSHKVHIFRIANRWGQTVFETTDEHGSSWDGTMGGVPQDAGVYYYYFVYDCNNVQQTMKGDVTLVR